MTQARRREALSNGLALYFDASPEMREELDVEVEVGNELHATIFDYPDRTVELHFYRCAIIGDPTPGWASLMVMVLFLGGLQMLMMGILGEYVWRALDEARRRPRYLIEDATEGRDEILRDPEDYGGR